MGKRVVWLDEEDICQPCLYSLPDHTTRSILTTSKWEEGREGIRRHIAYALDAMIVQVGGGGRRLQGW
eukprot:3227705-Rhodomonas_salina.3